MIEEWRRQLEASEARNRALMSAAAPAPPSPSDATQDAFPMVEELRKRPQESKAVLRVLETPAPQAAQKRPSETSAEMKPVGPLRRFLERLLSR